MDNNSSLDPAMIGAAMVMVTILSKYADGMSTEDLEDALHNRSMWVEDAVRELTQDESLDMSTRFQRLDEILRIFLRGFDERGKTPEQGD